MSFELRDLEHARRRRCQPPRLVDVIDPIACGSRTKEGQRRFPTLSQPRWGWHGQVQQVGVAGREVPIHYPTFQAGFSLVSDVLSAAETSPPVRHEVSSQGVVQGCEDENGTRNHAQV